MKKTLLFTALLCTSFLGFSQCPTDSLILNTQADIDNFVINYPNCTMLTEQIIIDGGFTEITNLNGLSAITHADVLYIQKTQIVDLTGLENLESAVHLAIGGNTEMTTLNGLGGLQTAGSLNLFFNNALPDLTGLTGLVSLGGLAFLGNENLRDLTELSVLNSLTYLSLTRNGITDLSGLENILTITDDLFIAEEEMTDLAALSNLQSIGGSIYIWDNDILDDMSALNSLTDIGGDLEVIQCENVQTMTGFTAMETIGGRLRIGDNPNLIDITVLSNVTTVGDLDIYSNASLQSLNGLQGLTAVNGAFGNVVIHNTPLPDLTGLENLAIVEGGLQISNMGSLQDISALGGISTLDYLTIFGCSSLPNLTGFDNLIGINGKLTLNNNVALNSIQALNDLSPTLITELVVTSNTSLSVCDIDLICTIIDDVNIPKTIDGNATGCGSIAEVQAECLLSISEEDLNSAISFYPNPVSETLHLNVSEGIVFEKAIVYSVLGERLQVTSEKSINFSGFSNGIYLIEVVTIQGSISKKIVKE